MSGEILSYLLNVAVLVCLGVTIFYAVRLSRSLNVFRQSRQEFGVLLESLSRSIIDAQKAIDNLKAASRDAGRDLQEILDESRLLADELQLINETSNNMAKRLETAAEKSRRIAQGHDIEDEAPPVTSPKVATFQAKTEKGAGFAIQDRDYGAEGDGDEDTPAPGSFRSQAEKDLYEALQKNKKSGGGF